MMKMFVPLVPALLAHPGVDDVLGVPDAGEVGHGVHPVTVRVVRPPHHQHPGHGQEYHHVSYNVYKYFVSIFVDQVDDK